MNFNVLGDFRPLHIGRNAASYSALATDSAIHFLYAVRGMFSYRIMYRKRHQAGLTAAITVCEAGRADGCTIFMVKSRIYACYLNGGALYVCESDDDGQSFGRPRRYRNKFCEFPVKAAFITETPPDGNVFAAREVYVDGSKPWDVQIVPDLYPDFYPYSSAKREIKQTAPPSAAEGDMFAPAPDEAEFYYGTDISGEAKLRNQMEMLERKLADKDRQLMGMASLKQELENQRSVIEKLFKGQEERVQPIVPQDYGPNYSVE
jgi:hypothetical protein